EGSCRLARLHSAKVMGPQSTTYSLAPEEGNLHQLEALEDCAFFDIVTPAYDASLGRDCTYYAVTPQAVDTRLYALSLFKPSAFTTQLLVYA
ncbi:unnamed protein product, partial [Polarella glacialis]